MTIRELYQNIGGDYDQAIRILRVDKLIDKHIRKFTDNGVMDRLATAAESMDATELFEASHAAKGVCANLGLVKLSEEVSVISEEFRPGKSRKFSDEEVKARLKSIWEMYSHVAEEIRLYEESCE